MRVGPVVLLSIALAVDPDRAHNRAIEIADTMSSALAKMVGGVEHFLQEADDAAAERSAHAFINQHKAEVTAQDVEAAEAKGKTLASQVLRNLKALEAAADALKRAARETPAPVPVVHHGDDQTDGYVAALENKVAGQKQAIADLEGEKKSLVASVASLMHRDDNDLKAQLADSKKKVVELEDENKANTANIENKASEKEAQLQSDNHELAERLEQCLADHKSTGKQTVEETVVTSEVQCKSKLVEAEKKLADAVVEHDSMVQTVNQMVQSTDTLKAELHAKENCTVPAVEKLEAAPVAKVDVAHMAETVKIDQYIATNGNPTHAKDDVPIKPVRFQASSVKAASDALAGKGDIGKYLRGAKEENHESTQGANAALAAAADVDTNDLEQQIDSLMPEDVDVIKAADAVHAKPAAAKRKVGGDDNLAQKLLLQAEQTLKLAA